VVTVRLQGIAATRPLQAIVVIQGFQGIALFLDIQELAVTRLLLVTPVIQVVAPRATLDIVV